MASRFDARLREMQFLARLDRDGSIQINEVCTLSPERQMLISLVNDGYVNGIDSRSTDAMSPFLEPYEHALAVDLWRLRSTHSQVANVTLSISHKGRVRLSELEQQLRTGRDRDETGLLWAKRHLETDLSIKLLSAREDAPLSVAFLDMNGLKVINDTFGHSVGDDAIRAFFQAVVSTIGSDDEAYRCGGDEVVVILQGASDQAQQLLERLVRQLAKLEVPANATAKTRLTASCGSVSTTLPSADAKQLLADADKVQYRAKAESKKHTPRVSTVAVSDGRVLILNPSDES